MAIGGSIVYRHLTSSWAVQSISPYLYNSHVLLSTIIASMKRYEGQR